MTHRKNVILNIFSKTGQNINISLLIHLSMCPQVDPENSDIENVSIRIRILPLIFTVWIISQKIYISTMFNVRMVSDRIAAVRVPCMVKLVRWTTVRILRVTRKVAGFALMFALIYIIAFLPVTTGVHS